MTGRSPKRWPTRSSSRPGPRNRAIASWPTGITTLGFSISSSASSQQVLEVLSTIQDPDLGRDVVSLGMIKELAIDQAGRVSFTFELTTPACPVRDRFKSQAQDAISGIPGVTAVDVRMTANVRP